ncbi:MAG: ABC transporter substrate-binding protein [Proteobacteria bacterium]|nr:ABC transporter substrate-binding protein [Pseudomonadota bacterium]
MMPSLCRSPSAWPLLAGLLGCLLATLPAASQGLVEPPSLAAEVTRKSLPRIEERLPMTPLVVPLTGPGQSLGRYGGSLRMTMATARDLRMMVVYGYARLVGYDPTFRLVADLAERFEVEGERVFTFHLRPGHRWSDGQPFTAADFSYYWEDVLNDPEISRSGLPPELLVDGEGPLFEVLDPLTVRYAWKHPNPTFLPALAGPKPLALFGPAHYLKQFHRKFVDAASLDKRVKEARMRNWVQLHLRMDDYFRNDNPDLPTLQPWMLATRPPSDRFVFKRNPYFHRVDANGQQLPYIDEVVLVIADSKIVPLKTGAGESDLQARYLRFDHYTFLKESEKHNDIAVRLWKTIRGAEMALLPDLTVSDPGWRALLRDARFRRALSLAINRHEINQVIYYGLATEGNNTVLPGSPLYDPDYRRRWAEFDLKRANALLDEIGLTRRDRSGTRLMPDGRPLHIVAETTGEYEQVDVLQLIQDTWLEAGIKLYVKPLHIEVLRNRAFAGESVLTVDIGIQNALIGPQTNPREFVPSSQDQLQWPKWGQYFDDKGRAGEKVDMPEALELLKLEEEWRHDPDEAHRAQIWRRILEINADQVFTIGLVAGARQPVVVSNRLRNLPEDGIYNWDPGAHFGIYDLPALWFAEASQAATATAAKP